MQLKQPPGQAGLNGVQPIAGSDVLELHETGVSEKLGYQSPDDLRAAYPAFFWKAVCPYIGDALRYLRATQDGKQWIANLYAHVFSEEHRGAITGA